MEVIREFYDYHPFYFWGSVWAAQIIACAFAVKTVIDIIKQNKSK